MSVVPLAGLDESKVVYICTLKESAYRNLSLNLGRRRSGSVYIQQKFLLSFLES